ncbi:hypothetical protein, partial [Cetobacterium sp.]|uniref:hypothetical protein n=1 Tax=Cetobacterium sp. TaxID=2071632 RepID=UPI003F34BA72
DLFVEKNNWEVSIDDVLVDGTSLAIDTDGNVVISTEGIGPNTSKFITVSIVYNLTEMTTTEVTLFDYGNVTSYIKNETEGIVADTTSNVETPLIRTPKVSLVKSRGEVDYTNPLEPKVIYSFEIKNETKVPVSGLSLVDKITNLSSLKATVLEVSGEGVLTNSAKDEIRIIGIGLKGDETLTKEITIKYSVLEMSTLEETVKNTAKIYPLNSDIEMAVSNEIETPLVRTPAVNIIKDALEPEYNEDGTAIVTYTFKVTNETQIPYKELTIVDEITVLDKLTVVKVEGGAYDAAAKKITLTEKIQNLAGLTSDDLVLKVTYNLDAMITEIETTKDKAYLYDTSINPPGDKNPPVIETPEVPVDIKKSPTATVEKTKGEINPNPDGTVSVIYTFTVKNTSMIPIENLELKDKIYNLGKVTINSVTEVTSSTVNLMNSIESKVIETYTILDLGKVNLPGNGEVTKSYEINYNLEGMETISQLVKDIATINLSNDENVLDKSDEVETLLEKSPKVSLTKTATSPVYMADGTVDVTYTFVVKNETKIPYENLRVVDKVLSLEGLEMISAIGGKIDGDTIELGTISLLGNESKTLTLTIKYSVENMTTTVVVVTDKAVIYDDKDPETPVIETPPVDVEIEKKPVLTITKSPSLVKYNPDGTASVVYTFVVNNPTKIPTSVTVVDKVLELGNVAIVSAIYEGKELSIVNNILQLPEVKDVVGIVKLEVEFKYDLSGMRATIDSVKDKGFLYENLETPLEPGTDPEAPGQNNTPSEEVVVEFEKSPTATVEKTKGKIDYNTDGTADVIYTFTVKNPTKIPHPNLTLVDKVVSLDNLKVISVSEGVYDETNGTITFESINNFVGTITKNIVIKYDLNGMVAELERAVDKAYLYDTSEDKKPGTGLDDDENIVNKSEEVIVEFSKDPKLTITKSPSDVKYNPDGTASVVYTFVVNNPTKIPTSVTVVDKV